MLSAAEALQAFENKKILVGITGGIAAYKSAQLVRLIKKAGGDVHVCMTKSATQFITPLTLEALSGNAVKTAIFDLQGDSSIAHTEWGRDMDAAVVAPCTASFLGRLAGGLADQMLLCVLMASNMPVLLCPAMNDQMWANPLVQRNVDILKALPRYHWLEPDEGWLACQVVGKGRLPDPPRIVSYLGRMMAPKPLAGRHLVVTAGPTREWLDPVRFLSNPSTGKMGYALAEAAWEAGARVTLITGPTHIDPPPDVRTVPVDTTSDLLNAVDQHIEGADALVMAVAPADYRPAVRHAQKVKKESGPKTLTLERTPDVLATVADKISGVLLVGFSAETHDLEVNAVQKATKKKLDLIFVNEVGDSARGTGFGVETNAGTLLDRDGNRIEDIAIVSKHAVARRILVHVADRLQGRPIKSRPIKGDRES